MKILLWGINYRPESTGIAPFNAELAEYFARRDAEISVVTGFAYYPLWRKAPGDRWRLFRREQINGVEVHRCGQFVPARVSTVTRILHELSFGLTSLLRVLLLPRADLYLVVSPPLCLGFFAWIATRLKRSRFIFHVQDLQPGAAVGLGMVKSRGFIRLLYALERFAYRHAAAVSGISDGMMDEFRRKGVPARRRIYFPNWLRGGPSGAAEANDFRARFGLPADHLLAVYSGNLGRKQGIEILLSAAERLARDPATAARPVTVVIAGAGAERAALEARVNALNLPQLRLLPLLSDEDYAAMLQTADLGLITQAPGTGRYFFPSKLLSLLQAGLPVATVADADSELARAVEEGGFGINVLPGQPAELASVLGRLAADRGALERLRERTVWVRRFDAARVLPQFAHNLEQIVTGREPTPALVGQHEPSRL
ncbi:WcaI family glycosyltransferase [Opitutus terrae]|uniref:Glycosyl transferase group 1 n=1 Tax=Opitutus terrae (strain DSM 11246 / JCM 15787 / PB90-1) TaxID=452637 RepID=B1ZT96_OPITP|nr:WcaI family glycosyltransferase [Opitutus terrae]ACB76550.1 glycosyl transferase group 1 [Opitutus terrae PB90-1]